MIDQRKSKIIQLIEANTVVNESSFVAAQCLEAIKVGKILGDTVSDIASGMALEIYQRRKISLDMSGKKYFGLNELIQSLSSIQCRVMILQIESEKLNITAFLSADLSLIIGMLAIEHG